MSLEYLSTVSVSFFFAKKQCFISTQNYFLSIFFTITKVHFTHNVIFHEPMSENCETNSCYLLKVGIN